MISGGTDDDRRWRSLLQDPSVERQLGSLWGKSAERGGGRVNLLLQHLFDTMAVGELLWNHFIAPSLRARLDRVAAAGEGRRLYVLLCGLHDIGKASPAFQGLQPALAVTVEAAGLPVRPDRGTPWRHERAGACILRTELKASWATLSQDEPTPLDWVWPMVAGHHGIFPKTADVHIRGDERAKRRNHGGDHESWTRIQQLLLQAVILAAGWDEPAAACPVGMPSRADQLALSGFITMADWIASDTRPPRFAGVEHLSEVSMESARRRAGEAWASLALRGGWGRLGHPGPGLFAVRFGADPRPTQEMVVRAAQRLPEPGLLVVEAPMGEGKTEAALAAAEVLAARFGCNGVYVAMPTQATSDAMFERVRRWLDTFDPPPQVALLHGRRRLSGGIEERQAAGGGIELDEHGLLDPFAALCEELPRNHDAAGHPADWFYGRRRGLLAANGVGTIDQALYAGARTKYVSLRYAGLAGKVVIFDEVHAADTYMSQFLGEVLWWLGNGQVPVVLLSATLAPGQRDRLIERYLAGSVGLAQAPESPALGMLTAGYPSVTSAWSTAGHVHRSTEAAAPWRASLEVRLSVRGEAPDAETPITHQVVAELVAGGGCALVIHNTVDRAQRSFQALRPLFGDDVVLLHSRFTADARARTTQRLLDCLGRDGGRRPRRLAVVATQVAEQSFDVDADVLVTDIAPVDLLLQRAGRLHRHQRAGSERPSNVKDPQIVVTGLRLQADGAPWFPSGSEKVYGRHHLLQAAALVLEAARGSGWSVPADVPALVVAAYGDAPVVPDGWLEDAERARARFDHEERQRTSSAQPHLLAMAGEKKKRDLAGLHKHDVLTSDAESVVRVRDGEMGEEVVLVRLDHRGGLETVEGIPLGPNGDAGRGRPEVLGSVTRVPTFDSALASAVRELGPLPGWRDDPWLGRARALQLDHAGRAGVGASVLTYDPQLGLTIEPRP